MPPALGRSGAAWVTAPMVTAGWMATTAAGRVTVWLVVSSVGMVWGDVRAMCGWECGGDAGPVCGRLPRQGHASTRRKDCHLAAKPGCRRKSPKQVSTAPPTKVKMRVSGLVMLPTTHWKLHRPLPRVLSAGAGGTAALQLAGRLMLLLMMPAKPRVPCGTAGGGRV